MRTRFGRTNFLTSMRTEHIIRTSLEISTEAYYTKMEQLAEREAMEQRKQTYEAVKKLKSNALLAEWEWWKGF